MDVIGFAARLLFQSIQINLSLYLLIVKKYNKLYICNICYALHTFRSHKNKSDKDKDKFKDSLSEGLKIEQSSSSDEEIGDIKIDEDEDEEEIIEKRRKQREELLKVYFLMNWFNQC